MISSEKRYLHIAGGFAAGGWFTGLGPNGDVNVPIETVADVHLPMVGGVSEKKGSKIVVDTSKADFGKLDRKKLTDLRSRVLLTLGSGTVKSMAGPVVEGKLNHSNTVAEIKALKVDGLSLKRAVLTLSSEQDPACDKQPRITFGETAILGLKLGKSELTITLDTDSYNKYPTMQQFEDAYKNGKLPRTLVKTLATDDPIGDAPGTLHRNSSGYVVGSLVKKIEGELPKGASIDSNGYSITWPDFGRIVLGEVWMGGHIRRVTLMRLKHSDEEFCSGCSGGSYYP